MPKLPEPWYSAYEASSIAIKNRLQDFSEIPQDRYFYELIFCILTPQSSAKNADATIAKLEVLSFFDKGFDPTEILRHGEHYIRFHNTKAKRLLRIREEYPDIFKMIVTKYDDAIVFRQQLREKVPGFGLKETSHFLRNVGFREFAILDRHILKHLLRLKVIETIPTSMTDKQYLSIEERWKKYAKEIGIPIDELDLLFWSMETGEIRK